MISGSLDSQRPFPAAKGGEPSLTYDRNDVALAHDVADDPHLSKVEYRVAARKSKLAAMAGPDRAAESRKASIRGMAKNLNRLNVLFASANWVMRARAVALMG